MLRGTLKTPAEFAEFLKRRGIEAGAVAPTTSAQNK
jgi:hypothetical protein